jgi:hypothetical protein
MRQAELAAGVELFASQIGDEAATTMFSSVMERMYPIPYTVGKKGISPLG